MGVDIKVKSTRNPSFYALDDPNQFLKYAWRDIRWEDIFDCLHIDISPWIYYDDPDYNYRSPDQVESMRDAIKEFVEKTVDYYGEDTMRLRDELHDDAAKLLEFFDYYVENEAHIVIF